MREGECSAWVARDLDGFDTDVSLRGNTAVSEKLLQRSKQVVSMTLPQAKRREATIDGRRVRLRPGGHRLLKLLLLSNPQRFISPQSLVETMWPNPDTQPLTATNIVRVYVTWLRKLGVHIERQNGFGYRIPPENRGLPEHCEYELRLAA
jgi:DNA-binding response OmpR family regulator